MAITLTRTAKNVVLVDDLYASVQSRSVSGGGGGSSSIPTLQQVATKENIVDETGIIFKNAALDEVKLFLDSAGNLRVEGSLTSEGDVNAWASGTSQPDTVWDALGDHVDDVTIEYSDGTLTVIGGGGVSDHGALTGLADDDHTQYFNQARGDARYALSGHNHSGTYEPAFAKNTGFNLVLGTGSGQVAEGNHVHSGVYEPAFSKNTGFNLVLGTGSGQVAEGNHSHSGLWSVSGSIYYYNSGDVGIGTNNPQYGKLQVNGTGIVEGVAIFKGSGNTCRMYHDTDNQFYVGARGGVAERGLIIDALGNVGITEPAPSARLHVTGSNVSGWSDDTVVRIQNEASGSFGSESGIVFGIGTSPSSKPIAGIMGEYTVWNATNSVGGGIRFYTKSSATEADMTAKAELEHDGDFKVKGDVIAYATI